MRQRTVEYGIYQYKSICYPMLPPRSSNSCLPHFSVLCCTGALLSRRAKCQRNALFPNGAFRHPQTEQDGKTFRASNPVIQNMKKKV